MKVLIAGLGSIGRRHLRNLIELGCKEIIVYRTHMGMMAEENFPGVSIETNLENALGQEPDAVVIANPTSKHMDVAIPAAQKGCALLIEKPISNQFDHVDELAAIVSMKDIKTLIGFQFRFHPGIKQAFAWLKDGAIGRPLSVQCVWGEYLPDWHPWEDYRKSYSARSDLGGGVVLTLSHPLDYLHWMLGQVDEIMAMTGKVSDLELMVEDTAEIEMRFQNGTAAHVHLDYYRQPAEHRFEIIGTEGIIDWRNLTGAARLFRTRTETWETSLVPERFDRNDLFIAEMKHFIAVIDNKEKSICDLGDGIYNLRLALAVHQSARSKKVVKIE